MFHFPCGLSRDPRSPHAVKDPLEDLCQDTKQVETFVGVRKSCTVTFVLLEGCYVQYSCIHKDLLMKKILVKLA